MTSTTLPPSLAERLLRASVRDPQWRESITGDLREEFQRWSRTRGTASARRWYWRQAVPLAARFLAGRMMPALTPPRRRLAVADIERTSLLGAGWAREIRHAVRALAQRPGLTFVMIVTLGVTLAANAVIFNLADAMYLRPFRFKDVDRLVLVVADIVGTKPYIDNVSVAPADFRDWTHSATTVNDLRAVEWWDPNLSGVDIPEQVPGFRVSPGFFELLGAQPVMGRTFAPDDGQPEAHRRVVLAHAFWVRQFAADPSIVGRTVRLDGEPFEVIGVMPPRFAIPFGAQVWSPIAYDEKTWAERERGYLMVMGRLAPGQTVATAHAEFTALAKRQAEAFPATNRERPASVVTFTRGLSDEAAGSFLIIWQAAAGLLLFIACANIANLMLARGTEREPEFAVRLALGAGRGRLILQLFIEGLCLAAMGVALGTGLTALAMRYTLSALPAGVIRFVPGYEFIGLDARVVGAMALLAVVATVVFSLLPAVHSSRAATASGTLGAIRSTTGSGRRQWVRSVLAGAQVAVTLALAVATTLILGAVDRAMNGALGFEKSGLMTAQLTLPERPYEAPERRRQFTSGVLDRLQGLPGVTSVAAVSTLPYSGASSSRPFTPEGAPADAKTRDVQLQRISEFYFETIRTPLVAGRHLNATDRPDAPPVAVVSQALAERYWPGLDAVGRRFRVSNSGEWITVVGVVADVIHDWFTGRKEPTVYRPLAQDPTLSLTFVARTAAAPGALARGMRAAVSAADADQPILALRTMDEVVVEKLAGVDYFARLLVVMSSVALLLALMGIYSLMAYVTARRTREIGVRVALGATSAQVTRLAATRATWIVVGGVVVGTALAAALSAVMQSALFGLVVPQPATIAVAIVVLAAVTMAAGYLPARKAARQDPWAALRTE
jgi:putative ABC transport system permease protein